MQGPAPCASGTRAKTINDVIDIYCERLSDAFWAEPLNVLANAAFFVAAYLLFQRLRGTGDAMALFLTGLIAVIGLGSFFFHTYANWWAALTDTLPIVLFMVFAVGIGLKRRFGFENQAAALGAVMFLFFTFLVLFSRLVVWIPAGTAPYLPALLMLIAFAVLLVRKRDDFAVFFVVAVPVFALGLLLRAADGPLCELMPTGTHFAWHVLNALTLYLLVFGLMRRPTAPHDRTQ